MSEIDVNAPKFGFLELVRLKNPYTRQRYWGVIICSFLANAALSFMVGMLMAVNPLFGLLALALGILFTWIYIAATVKRLRDAGLSLYWTLLGLVPLVSFFTMILYGCFPSAEPKNMGRARGVVAVALLCFLAIPVFAVAAYLVYNTNAQQIEQQTMSQEEQASLKEVVE